MQPCLHRSNRVLGFRQAINCRFLGVLNNVILLGVHPPHMIANKYNFTLVIIITIDGIRELHSDSGMM